MHKIRNILFSLIIPLGTFFIGCASRKELEAAKHEVTMIKFCLIIAIAIAVIGIIVFLIIGIIMGSKARRDAKFQKTSNEDRNE